MDITGEGLLTVFADYNLQIWPMQILAYTLGLLGLYLGFRKDPAFARMIPAILAFFWLWVGLIFWLPSATQGFTLGYLFTVMFAIEGVLFLLQMIKPQLAFGTYSKTHTILGTIFMLYALIGYLLLGLLIGHVYPRTPPFGLTPCPLIIYTFGLLLLVREKVPKILLAIPFFYALSGVLWITIGILEDFGLVLSGLVGVFVILRRDKQLTQGLLGATQPNQPSRWSLDLQEPEDNK